MADIECAVCGGKDFHQESGFYYCNDCQTQTQDIREHVFDETNENTGRTKKIKRPQKTSDQKLTSWECWNVVLVNLTNELINLGANPDLKRVVKCLWMEYLVKNEVINLKRDNIPKLQIVNMKEDLGVLYGKKKRRRSRSSCSSHGSVVSSGVTSVKRERNRKKKALAAAHYERVSQKSQLESSSLHDETLTSLKSSDHSTNSRSLQFNKHAINALSQTTPKGHIKRHKHDMENNLKCHFTYRTTPQRLTRKPTVLTQARVFNILYLGLLINNDDMQLCDLLRFAREGSLSYNNFQHMFPEDFSSENLSISAKNHWFLDAQSFRKTTAQLAHFLEVSKYVETPDLVKLSERFCKELSLPRSIHEAVVNIMSKTKPKLLFKANSTTIPNYEGRVMSIILFVLKLLFSFDGKTEFEFGKYARLVNAKVKTESFDIVQWLEYLQYRKLLIEEYHFPSHFLSEPEHINSDLLLHHMKTNDIKVDGRKKQLSSDFKEIIDAILNLQTDVSPGIDLHPSLTPFRNYTQQIMASQVPKERFLLNHILQRNFENCSIKFLLKPFNYLNLISSNEGVVLKHGGANDNWCLKPIKNLRSITDQTSRALKEEVLVAEGDHDQNLLKTSNVINNITEDLEYDSKRFQRDYQEARKENFLKNVQACQSASEEIELKELNGFDMTKESEEYKQHFNAYERFWVNYQLNLDRSSVEESDKVFAELPDNFQLVLREMGRMLEQSNKQILTEYQLTEAYLVYKAKYYSKVHYLECIITGNLQQIVKLAEKNW